ncbi:MAG: stalk domain-containing protein [Gudongella sp.]|nr:stalk domain-containing protein [Gudongella sp.]
MSRKLSSNLRRQHRIWEQTQEKRRKLLRRSAASTMAAAMIAAKLMAPVSVAEANSTYSGEVGPETQLASVVDENSDETAEDSSDESIDDYTDETSDDTSDGTQDDTSDEYSDEASDENTDGISDYSGYDFSDEYSDGFSDEWDSDERIFELRDDRSNLTLLRVGKEFYFVNDERARLDAPPLVEEDRTILPVRFIAQAMGSQVLWDQEDRRVTIVKGEDIIELWIDSNLARVNGTFKLIDPDNDSIRARIVPETGRTMVPVRFVAETLGAEVFWDEETKTISLRY